MIDKAANNRPRILCVVDGPDWIFNRHVSALQHYLGDEFDFFTVFRGHSFQEEDYDLLYPLEFNMISPEQIKHPQKYVTGIRSFVSWADWDFLTLCNFLVTHFQKIHVVSRELFDHFSPYISDLSYVTHGVDIEFFSPLTPPNSEKGHLRLGWAGNRKTIVKGFRDFIAPLSSLPGVELIFHGLGDQKLTYEEMPKFYSSIDAYISTSSFEGNNNSLLEAAAMGRAIVTTPAGTVPEYLRNNFSALIVDRDLEQIQSAVLRLRDNPDLRIYLGQNARKAVMEGGWDWKNKAEEYRLFFRQAIMDQQMPFADRLTIEPVDLRQYADVLHTQFVLERELRIGYAKQCLELEKQIEEIKKSETYRLTERIKSFKLFQVIFKLYQRFRPTGFSKSGNDS